MSPDNLLRIEIKSMRVVIVAWKFVETVVGDALSVASTVFNAEVAIFMGGSKMDSAFLRGVGESFLPQTWVCPMVMPRACWSPCGFQRRDSSWTKP